MKEPHDPAYGVKSFSIAGRLIHQRERLKGMSDTERQWRAQWLKDQELSPDEPRDVPEYYLATNNIFRRLYKTPLYTFQTMLEPLMGYQNAYYARHTLGKGLMMLYGAWACYYIYKYYSNNWTNSKSIEIYVTRPIIYPDDPNYPNYPKIEEYYDMKFSSSVLANPEKRK